MGPSTLNQEISLMNLLDEETILKIAHSTWTKIWTVFSNFGTVSAGTLGRFPRPIFFGLTHVVVLEKLSDKYFFLCAQNGFEGVKTTPEKCGTKYPFNCFTYNYRIFHNQTNSN